MATLALSVAGQVVGGLVGGPVGATIGRALGALAGSAIDSAIFAPHAAQPTVTGSDIALQGSSEGVPLPRIYGWNRLTGNIIWATQLEEMTRQSSGAKGTAPNDQGTSTTILANFAVGLCEGEVHRLGRIWADGELLETEGLNLRFYRGTSDQLPDSLIEAKQGAGHVPAYRGLCYLVFEGLPLTDYGNRIPNISVELCRVVGDLEPAIRAVTIIPGATEFGYDPTARVRIVGPGATVSENAHLSNQTSDWALSLDELQALCPNLEHVSLVVSWFADDLRCGSSTIRPKVEGATRQIEGTNWVVSGLSRSEAEVVSTHEDGPAYGGTPSDAAVLAAIADLKARGLKVTLYPMILMDIPVENTLPDPYSGATGQSAYPWRGRITCSPAPGLDGTPDQTSAITADLDTFLGSAATVEFSPGAGTVNFSGGPDWGYRRMVLHYAALALMAGGVDTILIGSEMVGATRLRDGANGFPFVSSLVSLAADVRAMTGAADKITYAADWSEFSGLQPADAPGDKFFHLDALWASEAIDAIGIDNYLPLTDWREGTDHPDYSDFDGPYDPAYLKANIAGGEGFDWYYASAADRIAANRAPITDGDYDEPWIWRFKDLVSWWTNPHHNRIGGVRSASPTAWVPQSKPIWFTELGCPAVDKGANQPNVFPDPKSSESATPYFSNASPDPLMQRQFLRAHFKWWRPDAPGFEAAQNPVSEVYAAPMLDPDRMYLWTWDARPYPAFPNDVAVWSDGPNYQTGHWLTGRLGALASDELITAMASDWGVVTSSVQPAAPLIFGVSIANVSTMRDASASMVAATGLGVRDRPDGVSFAQPQPRLALSVNAGALAAENGALTSRKRPDPADAIGRIALSYLDRERDYLTGTVTAMRLAGGAGNAKSAGLVLDQAGARRAAEKLLAAANPARDGLDFILPPSLAVLEVGDTLDISGERDGPFVITEMRDGLSRKITAQMLAATADTAIVPRRVQAGVAAVNPRAMPLVAAAHFPPEPSNLAQSRLLLGAFSDPWPGIVSITDEATGKTLTRLGGVADLGELTSALEPGPGAVWDEANTIAVNLYTGHLASADRQSVLAGTNRLAVKTDAGEWECIGFANAALVSPGNYLLTSLLRGLEASLDVMGPASAGNRVMVLNDAIATDLVPQTWLGETLALRTYAGASDATGTPLSPAIGLGPVLPLAPAHLRATRDPTTSDVNFTWVRRSRADSGNWNIVEVPLDFAPEAYEVVILDGANPVRTLAVATPAATYFSADQIADFSTLPASFAFTVSQVSALFGPGHSASGEFNA